MPGFRCGPVGEYLYKVDFTKRVSIPARILSCEPISVYIGGARVYRIPVDHPQDVLLVIAGATEHQSHSLWQRRYHVERYLGAQASPKALLQERGSGINRRAEGVTTWG
jgi:hypothetical protein